MVTVIREDPKHFVLKSGNDRQYFDAVSAAYRKSAGKEVELKNSFLLERGSYTIAAVLDESVSDAPMELSGVYIDLFDKDLPVLTHKVIRPGEQGYLYNVKRISGRAKAKVLCGASRIYDERQENEVIRLWPRARCIRLTLRGYCSLNSRYGFA